MSPFRPLSTMESVALYPENGDVVHLRCGRVSYVVNDPVPAHGGGVVVVRQAVEHGEAVKTGHCVDHTAWRDLVRLGASSVERAADVLAGIHEVLATPGGGA